MIMCSVAAHLREAAGHDAAAGLLRSAELSSTM
jgi:hypothetical protein